MEEQTKKIIQTWNALKDYSASGGDLRRYTLELANKISASNEALRVDLEKAYDFALGKFSGLTRKDGKTPLVLHSLFLTELLYMFGERDKSTYLTAILHDTIEDTETTWNELEQLTFETQRPITSLVKYLTEDKSLPKDGIDGCLSERVQAFIRQLKKAPSQVVNTEIVDRLHDLCDLGYLLEMPEEKRRTDLKRKATKCKNIVYQITEGRNDYNNDAANTFFTRIKEIETELGETIPVMPVKYGGV